VKVLTTVRVRPAVGICLRHFQEHLLQESARFLGRSFAEAWVAREHHQQEGKGVVRTTRPKEFNTTEEEEE
jgi:hypothetical protein